MTDQNRYGECSEVREDLSAYFDGELSPDDRAAMEAHLRDCAECLRELDAHKRVDVAYAGLAPVNAPEGFEAGVKQAVSGGKSARSQQGPAVPRWAGPLVALAAAGVVVIGGVMLLELGREPSASIAMAPEAPAAAQKADADAPVETAVASGAASGAWDAFTTRAADDPPEATTGADTGQWDGFVGQSKAAATSETAADSVSVAAGGVGRDDASELQKRALAAAPESPVPSVSEDEALDRAAVIGEPPAGVSPRRAEALHDAAAETARNESQARRFVQDQANQAQAAGEVVQRTVLRSFTVAADGTWYEKGYDGEAAIRLARGSDTLREVMKQHAEFDWNKVLNRSARQVFQLNGTWYDLDALPE